MGCSGSLPVSQQTAADKQYFESVAKLRGKRPSGSIEDARKRREECAKQRARRASVMGQLEAEKLIQRKRSTASMINYSGSDVSAEAKVPTFEAARQVQGAPQDGTIRESSVTDIQTDGEHGKSTSKSHIKITVSSGSRPGSSWEKPVSCNDCVSDENKRPESEADDAIYSKINNENHAAKLRESEASNSYLEEEIRQNAARVIVQNAIDSALAQVESPQADKV